MKEAEDFVKKQLSTKARVETLPQSGSARNNYVVHLQEKKYILTENYHLKENESFLYFSKVFSDLKLNSPKILEVSKDKTLYLQEHVGEKTLFELLSELSDPKKEQELLQKVLDALFHLQQSTQGKIDYSHTFEYEKYDQIPIQNDLNYFKFFIVDLLELPYHKTSLLQEFQALGRLIEQIHPKGIMIRDFQSRNIMVNENDEVYFIDYQSAMYGPLLYDVLSFLYQARAPFLGKRKKEMLDYYIAKYPDASQRKALREAIMPLRLIRGLQVLGAYGFRGLVQQKPHFLSSLELGIKQVCLLAKQWKGMKSYPELEKVILLLAQKSTKQKIKAHLNTNTSPK